MLLHTAEGIRTVRDDDVLYVYAERDGVWATATLCMANGEEITGRCLREALNTLEAKLEAIPDEAA